MYHKFVPLFGEPAAFVVAMVFIGAACFVADCIAYAIKWLIEYYYNRWFKPAKKLNLTLIWLIAIILIDIAIAMRLFWGL